MSNRHTLRRLGARDLQDWKSIRRQALETAPRAFGRTLASFTRQTDADHLHRLSGSVLFGAFAGQRIIGSAGWHRLGFETEHHRGRVTSFFVLPDYQGTGLADRLMGAILDEARGVVVQLELDVTTQNARARKFYERHGFDVVGTMPRALRHDGLYLDEHMMVLRLNA